MRAARLPIHGYRLGVRSEIPEEQFSYFWFTVEIAAEALKEAGKIAPKCPVCSAEMFCPSCNAVPQRRRFSTDAIEDLICAVAPADADKEELTKTLFMIRNALQHGRRIQSIAVKLPCTEEQAVNVLARIALRSILRMGDIEADPAPDDPMSLVEVDDVVAKRLVVSANIVTRLMGEDHDNPNMRNAPAVELSMMIDDKKYSFDGKLIDD